MDTKASLRLLGVKDLQKRMGFGMEKTYALMHSVDFPSMKLGKSYFVTEENLEKWLKESEGKEIQLQYGKK